LLGGEGIGLVGLVLGMRADGWDSHQDLVDRLTYAPNTARKPLMVVSYMSNSLTRHWRGYAQAHNLPLIEDLERGLKAVRHLIEYAAFRRSAERRPVVATMEDAPVPAGRVLTQADGNE